MLDIDTRTRAVNDATYAAWNAPDPDAVVAVFAVDAVLREAGSPDVLHGRDALFGIPPSGRTVRVEGATFTRMGPHGLVVEDIHFADMAGLLAQLGV